MCNLTAVASLCGSSEDTSEKKSPLRRKTKGYASSSSGFDAVLRRALGGVPAHCPVLLEAAVGS